MANTAIEKIYLKAQKAYYNENTQNIFSVLMRIEEEYSYPLSPSERVKIIDIIKKSPVDYRTYLKQMRLL